MFPYGNQQQYGYGGNQGYPQQTGYTNNWSTQPQPQQPPPPPQRPSQSSVYGFDSQSNQPVLSSQQTGGWNQQQPMTSFQSQPTGGQGLLSQRTGYQDSSQSQPTGAQGLMPQRTGYQPQPQLQPQPQPQFQQQSQQQFQQPLTSQATGWNQQAPPTTSFQAQATGGLMPQATGYFQPQQQFQQPLTSQSTGWNQQAPPTTSFQAQATGGLMTQATGYQQPMMPQSTGWNQQQQQPPTSFGNIPLQSQATGWNNGSLQPQATGISQPLTAQPTGFISTLSDMGTQNNDLVLPNIRLSFITARDQERFENIFRRNVSKGENAMDGNTARSILMKSQLSAVQLSNIWELADTNKSGSLMFPEFCVALHLANMAKRGQSVPFELPIKIKNEVTGFVDAINFNSGFANKTSSSNPIVSQTTGYSSMPLPADKTGLVPLTAQQTAGLVQAQPNGMLTSQPTGFFSNNNGSLIPQPTGTAPPMTSFMAQQTGGMMPQRTGSQPMLSGFQPQQTGFQPQPTGFQPQPTGFQPQPTGFQSQPTGFQSQPTGFQSQPTGGLMPQATGLQPMPTGKPGQWGFVSAPTGGLPGLDMMQSHFMPNSQSQSSLLQNQMGGSGASNVTWAITKQEKLIYDNIFKQWDKERKGFVSGDIAIGVFTKSGLSFGDLEKIWTLCDQGNKGKLNKDEFAVAMHLIYRRLNGFDIPTYLPPELVPPSSKVLENTVDSLKDQLRRQASNGGVGSPSNVKQDITRSGTTYKNDDNSIGYVSTSRHRRKGDKDDAKSTAFSSKLSIDDLKKQIHEKRILLAAVDAEDEDSSVNYEQQKTINDIEMLKTKIKSLQSKLNSSNTPESTSIEEKEQLSKKLNNFSDKLPQLIDAISQMDEKLKAAKVDIFRLKLQKENPTGIDFRGTGPNGEITESDKRIAKQKALLQAKMAKLTGKPAPNFDAFEDNESKLNQEIIKVSKEFDDQKEMVKDISVSINSLITEVSDSLNLTNSMSVGYFKWEKKQGVQNKEVIDFIDYLNSTKPAHKTTISQPSSLSNPYLSTKNSGENKVVESSSHGVAKPVVSESSSHKVVPVAFSDIPSKLSTGLSAAEERAKKIKEKAEKRMSERLAKLGITRKSSSLSTPETPKSEEPEVNPTPKVNYPVQSTQTSKPPAPPPTRSNPPPVPTNVSKPLPGSFDDKSDDNSDSDSESNSDDDEYKALLAQKKAMEKRELERKERKKREKEERLAKLKAEMAALKKQQEEEQADSDDSWDEPKKQTIPEPKAVEKNEIPETASHSNNPFAPMMSSASNPIEKKEEVKPLSHNPFSKLQNHTSSASDIDQEKLKAQRASQMSTGKDTGWSDSGEEDSEDEMPTATKQAELASMLFGGSSQPSRTTTYIPPTTVTENPEVSPQEDKEEDLANGVEVGTPETGNSKFPPIVPETFPPPVPEAEPHVPEVKPPIPEVEPPIPKVPTLIPNVNEVLPAVNESEFYDANSDDLSFIDPTPPSSPETTSERPAIPTTEVPALPSSIPPPPPAAPELPSSIPPPPPAAPELPSSIPPPPPILQSTPTGGPPNINAVFGQILLGTSLKKVDESEKHIASGAVVGKVLD